MTKMPPDTKLPLPDDVREILKRLAGLSPDAKRDLAESFITSDRLTLEKSSSTTSAKPKRRPTTDDELHSFVLAETGYNIPRVAVCADHQAPFDFIADAFFERERALFLVGARELGKTLGVSIVHYVNAETRPGCTACTFGAIEEQANRAYAHVKSFIYTITVKPDGTQQKVLKPQIADTLRRRTDWKTGSAIEILIGSKSGVNSPHPNKVHADEVDLMDQEVFNESRSMASSSVVNGERIAAQDFATSTLKSNNGPVAAIIKECEEAEAQGFKAPWKVYRSCVFESAAEVPNCQCVSEDQRIARMAELGLDGSLSCECDRIVKGEWAEDNPRTLASVCKGKFFRARGWMEHDDVVGKFMQNVKVVWDAQMECRRPMADGLYLPGWSRERFCVKGWLPRPEYGRVFTGTDWGGGAESAILWCQYIVMPVTVQGPGGTMVTVPADSIVVFDELLKAGTGATKLASEVLARESGWRQRVPGFRIAARFADMAGRQQRDDWREHTPPLRTVWYLSSRDFDPQVECLQDLVEDKLYWADVERCSRHVDDIEGWRQKGGREVHDETSHSMAASRYMCTNIVTRSRRFQNRKKSREIDPAVSQRDEGSIIAPIAAMPATSGPGGFDAERRWRADVGQRFSTTTRGPGPWQQ